MKTIITAALIGLFILIGCKKKENEETLTPAQDEVEETPSRTFEMEYSAYQKDVEQVQILAEKTDAGNVKLTLTYVGSAVLENEDVTGYIVENSAYEQGEVKFAFTEKATGLLEYEVDGSLFPFDSVLYGNYHFRIDIKDRQAHSLGNGGFNANQDVTRYDVTTNNSMATVWAQFKRIHNGTVLYINMCSDSVCYYNSQVLMQLVKGSEDAPKEIWLDNINHDYLITRRIDPYLILLKGYSLEKIMESDAHLRILNKADSTLLATINIGQNAP